MDKTNQKILTMSFVVFAAVVALSVSLLLKTFAGAFGVVAKMTDADLVKHGLPVLIGIGLFLYMQLNKNILTWADEVVGEIRKVVWPSQKDTTSMTIVVIIMVLISSLIIATFDFLSGYIINNVIR